MKSAYLCIKKLDLSVFLAIIVAVIISGLLGYAYIRIFRLSSKMDRLASEIASTTAAFSEKTNSLASAIQALNQKTLNLSDILYTTEQNIQSVRESIKSMQLQFGGVEKTIGQITGAVTTLEKLSKTDPELLQKYSKIFFLNEHYVPERLVEIDKEYLYSEKRPESIHLLVWPRLKDLLDSAKKDGIALHIKSAYRSFSEQKSIKSAYTVVYGAGRTNQFSAEQGYSEHQLGTTADFITTGLGGVLSGFENTQAYIWLQNNAHKYGFILSYPEGNKYYIFEPWHWRYVGRALANHLKIENKNFYDLEQREIDAYLANIFD